VTSTTNARELDRLRKARTQAQERFAKQMTLLEQIVATAGDREAITRRWNGSWRRWPNSPAEPRRPRS
jgi:hypothetical protein